MCAFGIRQRLLTSAWLPARRIVSTIYNNFLSASRTARSAGCMADQQGGNSALVSKRYSVSVHCQQRGAGVCLARLCTAPRVPALLLRPAALTTRTSTASPAPGEAPAPAPAPAAAPMGSSLCCDSSKSCCTWRCHIHSENMNFAAGASVSCIQFSVRVQCVIFLPGRDFLKEAITGVSKHNCPLPINHP